MRLIVNESITTVARGLQSVTGITCNRLCCVIDCVTRLGANNDGITHRLCECGPPYLLRKTVFVGIAARLFERKVSAPLMVIRRVRGERTRQRTFAENDVSFSQTLFECRMKTNFGPFTCLDTSFVAHAAGIRCFARSHNSASSAYKRAQASNRTSLDQGQLAQRPLYSEEACSARVCRSVRET